MRPTVHRPRICFVGPMLGSNPGWVPNPMEALAPRLESIGYATVLTSRKVPRFARWAGILSTLFSRRRDYDLVCLQVYSGPSFVVEDSVVRASRVLRKPVVAVLHGGAFPTFAARWPDWVRSVFASVKRFVAPSLYLARAVTTLGYPVEVIPNLIALEDYPFRLRQGVSPRLLWMRTFHELYNPEMAVRVLERVRRVDPAATLLMCGQEKGLLAKVQALVARMGLGAGVQFGGFVSGDAKRSAFDRSDIFLNTNRVDNMPVSVFEAFASGTPVVATRVGGVPDLIEAGETGLLVPDDDDGAMAASVCRLLDAPDLAAHLSAAGRRVAETCDWPAVRPAWEKVFEEALA